MLHGPLSVIGSTCKAKSKAKQSRHCRQTSSFFLPPCFSLVHSFQVWGVPFWLRPSGRPHCKTWDELLSELTWHFMSKSFKWDDCIMCPLSYSNRSQLNVSDISGFAEDGGPDIDYDRLWEHRLLCNPCMLQSKMSGGQRDHWLLHHHFV